MADRFCARCGAKASPHVPRHRVGDDLLCAMCAQNEGRRVAALDRHPDLDENLRLHGCHHTACGRTLAHHRLGASQADQEARLAEPSGWRHEHTGFKPVRFMIEGARAYNSAHGLADPHARDYSGVHRTPDMVRTLGRAYDALPEHQDHAIPHFQAMAHEVGRQFDHLTNRMGVHVEVTDHDPYANVHEMTHDLENNKRIKVLGTHVTGGHSFFTNHQNDQFRAVHDAFGHAATGRDFSRHGERAAFLAHAAMFGRHALPAMHAETEGQNGSLILNGHFGPQKTAVLGPEHWDHDWASKVSRLVAKGWNVRDALMHIGGRQVALLPDGRIAVALRVGNGAIRRTAHDSGDGETIFHCPFCGSGQVIARNDGTTECEFCTTAFTVQVQPQMPAFPQTIDGVPVDVPGMPAGGTNANVPPGAAPGGDADPDADGAPFGADDGDADGADGQDPSDESAADSDDDGKPAFLKGSARFDSWRNPEHRELEESYFDPERKSRDGRRLPTWEQAGKKHYQTTHDSGLAGASVKRGKDGWHWNSYSMHPHCPAYEEGFVSDSDRYKGAHFATMYAEGTMNKISSHIDEEPHEPGAPCSFAGDMAHSAYVTVRGARLDETHYMQHLALSHARDRKRVLARVRHENGDG